MHFSASIRFLMDTGATRTIISDRDALRLGIDYSALTKLGDGMLGIGGPVDTYILKGARLIFNQENRSKHIEPIESLCLLKHSELSERILRLPSLLGRDVLNKYVLIYDKRQETAYLTDEVNH
jgi:hypothetical protein